jgi:hypothetical protein
MQSPSEWGGEKINLLQASLREFRFFLANPALRDHPCPCKQFTSGHAPFFPSVFSVFSVVKFPSASMPPRHVKIQVYRKKSMNFFR